MVRRADRAPLVALAALAVLAGCTSDGHELSVDLKTDLGPGVEFNVVRAELLATGAGTPRTSNRSALATDGFATGRRVAEWNGLDPGDYRLRVTLLDSRGGEVTARETVVRLSADLVLTVLVTRSCRAVRCPGAGDSPGATTCFGGRCVPPTCSTAGDTACGAPACRADSDCPALASCAVPRCAAGACFYEPRPMGCVAGQWCDPEAGCMPLPGDRDAGVTPPGTDAGGRDAGVPTDSGPECGDGACRSTEDCASCPTDCGACCGNGTCEAARGEHCGSCAADCGACCGNGTCEAARGEHCATCPADCPSVHLCDTCTSGCCTVLGWSGGAHCASCTPCDACGMSSSCWACGDDFASGLCGAPPLPPCGCRYDTQSCTVPPYSCNCRDECT